MDRPWGKQAVRTTEVAGVAAEIVEAPGLSPRRWEWETCFFLLCCTRDPVRRRRVGSKGSWPRKFYGPIRFKWFTVSSVFSFFGNPGFTSLHI